MSSISKLSKFSGRNFDIAILHDMSLDGEKVVSQSLVKDGGAICTGVQKLIQRFLLLLLTPLGSVKFRPKRGCNFLRDASRSHTEHLVIVAFRFAMMDISRQLHAEEDTELPRNECFKSATLVDVTFFGSSVSLSIRVTTQAGTVGDIILPIYSL